VEPGAIGTIGLILAGYGPLNPLLYYFFQGRDLALSGYFRWDRADGEFGQLLVHPVSLDMQVFICLNLNGTFLFLSNNDKY
jgi:hypothetical protein